MTRRTVVSFLSRKDVEKKKKSLNGDVEAIYMIVLKQFTRPT
ncbi:hypothetical protein JCM19235_1484 [Vibrio maritimus]|uniref:Uncharacterized protein n=1 Tax=Vibrio maritimus TaxID=990268 RepID=A0A090SQK0_9VIBR|nr:hypothetical protein JCM19235_1484 [Vibrio maritimus]